MALSARVCARRGGPRFGGGVGIFSGNFHVGGLWLLDLACHLVLTGSKLLDGCSHVGKMPLDGLSHRGDIRLYLLYLLRVEGRGRWSRAATVSGAV